MSKLTFGLLTFLPCVFLSLTTDALSLERPVYVGGVAGVETLTESSSSKQLRARGGGIYLHNSAWKRLSIDQRHRVVDASRGAPFAIEVGFGRKNALATAWAKKIKTEYLDLGINPKFILSNAYVPDIYTTVDQWNMFMSRIRAVNYNGPVYPIYAPNARAYLDRVHELSLKTHTQFQAVFKAAGGFALDAPPAYFLDFRDDAYKEWVLDAIQWCHQYNLTVVCIVSPDNSGDRFEEDSERFLKFLYAFDAMPDILVVENYQPNTIPKYVPVVGREWMLDTTMGVGWALLDCILPAIK